MKLVLVPNHEVTLFLSSSKYCSRLVFVNGYFLLCGSTTVLCSQTVSLEVTAPASRLAAPGATNSARLRCCAIAARKPRPASSYDIALLQPTILLHFIILLSHRCAPKVSGFISIYFNVILFYAICSNGRILKISSRKKDLIMSESYYPIQCNCAIPRLLKITFLK